MDKLCDVSTVPLVARWPVFSGLRIWRWRRDPIIDLLKLQWNHYIETFESPSGFILGIVVISLAEWTEAAVVYRPRRLHLWREKHHHF